MISEKSFKGGVKVVEFAMVNYVPDRCQGWVALGVDCVFSLTLEALKI